MKMYPGRRANLRTIFITSRQMLKAMKATAYQPTARSVQLHWSCPLFFFPPRHRFTLRLAGTRYSCVTVKLSVLLARPRIWGIPTTTVGSPAIDPITGPKAFPHDGTVWRAARNIFSFFIAIYYSCNYILLITR